MAADAAPCLTVPVDLDSLLRRESDQVEWKLGVADVADVVRTLVAFANDASNLGGGYVVCGVAEGKDAAGFPSANIVGLPANRIAELVGRTLGQCRDRVAPPILPLVEEVATGDPDRRVLVFVMPQTLRAHSYRGHDDSGRYFVRMGSHTVEARNGLLRQLLVLRGDVPPWDVRPCLHASAADLDVLAIQAALQRMGLVADAERVRELVSDSAQIHALVQPFCVREPLTGVLRPRNFALLLFGHAPQRHIAGAYAVLTRYAGTTRAAARSRRVDIDNSLLHQAIALRDMLDAEVALAIDKRDPATPNRWNYPAAALHEAVVNALAHRDYEDREPVRVTVFADRVEVHSPGGLPLGVEPEAFVAGAARPRWRNQALAWFLMRLHLAQAEGQGVATMRTTMAAIGSAPPEFELHAMHTTCTLRANPGYLQATE